MRVARPTNDLDAVSTMYTAGLGLAVLSRFADHDGYDGVILGCVGDQYHLELTTRRGERVVHAPTPEHLLVFYVPDHDAWRAACARMAAAGFRLVSSSNPYWDKAGMTFEDVEGYRVVLENAAWYDGES